MNALITSCLNAGKIQQIVNFPVSLLGDKEIKYVEWIRHYNQRYGKPPTLDRFRREFEFFIPELSEDPIGDLFDSELIRKKSEFAVQYLSENRDSINSGEDPTNVIGQLNAVLQANTKGVLHFSTFDRGEYLQRAQMLQFGIPQLDVATGGLGKGELTYLVGRPGSNKTTFSQWLVSNWWIEQNRILFVSNENPAIDVVAKIDAMIGGWNPLKRRNNSWSETDKRRIQTVAHLAGTSDGDIIVPEEPIRKVSSLAVYQKDYQPDVIVIDGVYLMSAETNGVRLSDHSQAAAVSRELKQLALATGTRIFGVIQANRKAEGGEVGRAMIANTDAYLQDADVLMAANKTSDGSVFFEVLKNRWGAEVAFNAIIDFDSMVVSIKRSSFEAVGGAYES